MTALPISPTAFNGTTDSNGNATIQLNQAANITLQGYYAVMRILVNVASGIPTWKATMGGSSATGGVVGSDLDYAIGSEVQLGPFYVAPNTTINVVCNGAATGTPINGTAMGVYGSSPADVVAYLQATNSAAFVGAGEGYAANASQMVPLTSLAVPTNSGASVEVGAQTPYPYPPGASSFYVEFEPTNIGTTSVQELVVFTNPGISLSASRRRDSAVLFGNLVSTGLLETQQTTFHFLTNGGSGTFFIFATGQILEDQFFDTAIYNTRVTGPNGAGYNIGFDGLLGEVNGINIGSSGDAIIKLPTYRGPAELGISSSASGFHCTLQVSDYQANVLDDLLFLGQATAAGGFFVQIPMIPGNNNSLVIFNQPTASVFNGALYAARDLT